ncbi:hypothetical protein QR98_0052610 [Sarcoptes scabiei]|uniref:Uncharacterized protein n=1 Tax=Sarcoptes scabiei TaxID=52283 RepID=A0A132A746_SARSC|nr:hypothetical protein QR98_0052610 [Sarcoptes scabiei]
MKRCYNQTQLREPLMLGQRYPTGMSIDYLVTLLEKIENGLPHRIDTKNLIRILLKRFHFDGIESFDNYFFDLNPSSIKIQNSREVFRRIINERLFNDSFSNQKQQSDSERIGLNLVENILTEDEKCAMFFMISHSINTTLDKFDQSFQQEYGVVSFLNNENLAISMNSVFLAIAIALNDIEPIKFQIDNEDFSIDPLLAVTLSDKLALAALTSINSDSKLFGSQGKWNSSYCQTTFRLDEDPGQLVTMAEFNGGIDGWFIGNKLKSDPSLRKLNLSTIIDRYYSRRGLSPDCGICSIGLIPESLIDDIQSTSLSYAHYWNRNFYHNNFEDTKIDGYILFLIGDFRQFMQKSKNIKYNGKIKSLKKICLNRFSFFIRSVSLVSRMFSFD